MKKLYLLHLLLLAVNISRAQDFVLKAVSDHFSISQNGQGINIYGNDIKDNLGNYFLKANGTHNTLAWSNITGTPTTLAGYGITDSATYTASNGLTQTGNNFTFGGALSGTTAINMNGNYVNFSNNNLGSLTNATHNTKGFLLQNSTSATVSQYQDSPPLIFAGSAWHYTPSAPFDSRFALFAKGTSDNNRRAYLAFDASTDGGATWSNIASLTNAGELTLGTFVSAPYVYSSYAYLTNSYIQKASFNDGSGYGFGNGVGPSTILAQMASQRAGVILPQMSTSARNAISGGNYPQYVTVTNGGSGYTSAPAVVFTGGLGTGGVAPNAKAIISGGKVVQVYLLDQGYNYTSLPTVGFSGGGGTGATATVSNIPTGLTLFNIDSARYEVYNGNSWKQIAYTGDATGGGGTLYTSSNGITKTGSDFTLGGLLTGGVLLNQQGNNFEIENQNSVNGYDIDLNTGNGLFTVDAQNLYNSNNPANGRNTWVAGIRIQNNASYPFAAQSQLYAGDGTNFKRVQLAEGTSGILLTDAINSLGAVYAADYSANFTARSLIDKGYADGHYGTISGTVPNSQTLTINGTTQDLSANRTWNVGTVTSFSKTDGFGIISSVTNPTTTPNYTPRVDTSSTGLQTVTNFFPKGDTRYQHGYVVVQSKSTGLIQTFTPSSNTDAARGVALQSAFSAMGVGDKINIGPGTYATTTTIALKDSVLVTGSGMVYNSNGLNDIFFVQSKAGVTISNIKIKGAGTPVRDTTKQAGIRINGYSTNFNAINLTISNCRGSGIFESQQWKDSTQYFNGGYIINCNTINNGYGFYGIGEYWTIDGGNHTKNLQAFYVVGGNIKVINTKTSYNDRGLTVIGIVGNEGHAVIANNTFTHNKKVGVYLKNLTIGEVLTGNIFAGSYPTSLNDTSLYLEATSGVRFSNSEFLAPMHIYLGGTFTGYNFIQNSHFYNFLAGGGNPANVVGTTLQKSHLIFTGNSSNDSLASNLNIEYGNNKTVQTFQGATTGYQIGQFIGTRGNFIYGINGSSAIGSPTDAPYSAFVNTGNRSNLNFGTNQLQSAYIDSTAQAWHFVKDTYLDATLSAGTATDVVLTKDASTNKIKSIPYSSFYKSADNVSFGTGAFSGLITSTLGNNSNVFLSSSATTGYQFMRLKNTNADFIFGIEGSTPVINSGAAAYSASLTTATATDLVLGSNQISAIHISGTTQNVTFDKSISATGTIATTHLVGNSGVPTIAAGAGAGTSPTVVISAGGTDISGVIAVTTGTSPTGSNAVIATVTFNTAYGIAPKVILQPGNSTTAALFGAQLAFTPALAQPNGPTTTTFTLVSGSTALAASTPYYWTYQVTQ